MTENDIIQEWSFAKMVATNIGSVTLSKERVLALDDLINRQKAEIERLKAENDEFREIIFTDRSEAIKMLKSEAIKEFAEELKRRLIAGGIFPVLVKNEIDSLAKEMLEENKNNT